MTSQAAEFIAAGGIHVVEHWFCGRPSSARCGLCGASASATVSMLLVSWAMNHIIECHGGLETLADVMPTPSRVAMS